MCFFEFSVQAIHRPEGLSQFVQKNLIPEHRQSPVFEASERRCDPVEVPTSIKRMPLFLGLSICLIKRFFHSREELTKFRWEPFVLYGESLKGMIGQRTQAV